MRLFCVVYEEQGKLYDVCYPAMNKKTAREMCIEDFCPNKIIRVEDLGKIKL